MDAQSYRDSILQQLDDIELRVEVILESYEPYQPYSQDKTVFELQTVHDFFTAQSCKIDQFIDDKHWDGNKIPDFNLFYQMCVDTEAALEKFKTLIKSKVKLYNSPCRHQQTAEPEQMTHKIKRKNLSSSTRRMNSQLCVYYTNIAAESFKMEKEFKANQKELEIYKKRYKELVKENEEATAKAKNEADKLRQQLEKINEKRQTLKLFLEGENASTDS
ncbi:uncharacterized protein [Dysidea avara]|uniref:uncharacterized protein n=1 Tax=Dysidea avara TaxID=196820 RepID=UPI00331EF467